MNRKCLVPFRFNLRKSLADSLIRLCEILDPQRPTETDHPGEAEIWQLLRYTIKFQIGRERSAVPCPSKRSVGWMVGTVDGWNLANQLRLGVYPIMYMVFSTIPAGWEWDFWSMNSRKGIFSLQSYSGAGFFSHSFIVFCTHPNMPVGERHHFES